MASYFIKGSSTIQVELVAPGRITRLITSLLQDGIKLEVSRLGAKVAIVDDASIQHMLCA